MGLQGLPHAGKRKEVPSVVDSCPLGHCRRDIPSLAVNVGALFEFPKHTPAEMLVHPEQQSKRL